MADKFVIKGGRELLGEVEVRGSKNAASKMMVASLLTDEPVLLKNIPLSSEIEITRELCSTIGSSVRLSENHECAIETKEIKTSVVPELSRKNRIPILALGPLLHRKGFAEVPVLGGCPIGHRPINFHVEALERMGVHIERREHSYYAEAKEIRGAEIEFPYPSVGATENIMLAGVLAKGKTLVKNAATEPEIANLIEMLRTMGAKIFSDEEKRIVEIEGVSKLRGVVATVMPDRNEIVSLAVAGLATGGDIFVKNISASYLKAFLEKIEEVGGRIKMHSGGIQFSAGSYKGAYIETSPHPGFMTDWQQPFCVLLTAAEGESIIHETVYEDRFAYTKDLNRMGANIRVSDECPQGKNCRYSGQGYKHTAHIIGGTPLKGADLTVTDLRAGMAHIIAALAAEGESIISGIGHVDRGYEKIDERLKTLGADIKRVKS